MASKKSRRARRRSHRRRGGASALTGAPLNSSLSNSWPSRMSAGQGVDYLKIHQGQHGGMAPISSIGDALPASMRTAAMLGGIDQAMAGIRGLKDQAGGRRRSRRSRKSKRSARKSKRSARKNRRSRRRRGGALNFAPVGMSGMLPVDHSAAGLNPSWKSNVEFDAATARDAL